MIVLRSLLAVIAGLIVVIAGSTVIDQVMHASGIIPPGPMWNPWHNALALTYRILLAMAGGAVTAKLAPRNPIRHVAILGMIGTLGGIAGIVATAGLNFGPRWYPIALAVTAFPSVWLGGWLLWRWRAVR